MQVSYHNRHAETVWKAWSLYTNLLFSCSKFYSVFMTSHPGGVTLSTVHGGPEMVFRGGIQAALCSSTIRYDLC
jgi:hypothetical protein